MEAKLPPVDWPGQPRAATLGRLETLVMDCLWRGDEPKSVRDVSLDLNGPWAYTTLMTTLDRLFKKKLATREPRGRAFVYRPSVSRTDLGVRALKSAISDIHASESTKELAIAALVNALESHDPAWLDSLDRLVREKKRAIRSTRKPEDRR